MCDRAPLSASTPLSRHALVVLQPAQLRAIVEALTGPLGAPLGNLRTTLAALTSNRPVGMDVLAGHGSKMPSVGGGRSMSQMTAPYDPIGASAAVSGGVRCTLP